MIIIEIRPHKWGWRVFEAPGVEPVFLEKRQAIDYAETRACFRSGEIRVLDSSGNVERTIAFNSGSIRCSIRSGMIRVSKNSARKSSRETVLGNHR